MTGSLQKFSKREKQKPTQDIVITVNIIEEDERQISGYLKRNNLSNSTLVSVSFWEFLNF